MCIGWLGGTGDGIAVTQAASSDRFEGAEPAIKPLPKVGQELGKFIIERELPRGGQARVFRAWQMDLSRPVALKILPPSFATDDDALSRFRREVENVARVSHPNIVRIFEAGEIAGYPFFSMEYLDGDDCETLLRRGPMSPDDAAGIMEAIARAIAEAHAKGIVHRDIKPGNVIVREDQTPVLTDFGLAQDVTQSAQLTQTGVSMGTPAYMSPEQARGERNRVGKRSDIYALGATLFTLLTGKRPAEGGSAYEVMLKVAAQQSPPWPKDAHERIPADLRAIVEMAMQNDPAKRYESAKAMAEDLERFLRGDWVTARSRTWMSKAWHRVRRYAAVAAVIAVSASLSAGLIITSMNPNANTARPGEFLHDTKIWPSDESAMPGDAAQALSDKWQLQGATLERAAGSERFYARSGEAPIMLAYREPICWGDFELECQFSATEAKGEVSLLIGASEAGGEPAYRIVIGAEASNRFEIRRMGRPLVAGVLPTSGSPFGPSTELRAWVARSGESLRFELRSLAGDLMLAQATLDDAYPTLHSGHDRFAMSADAKSLLVRGVSVRHRGSETSRETVLFLEGNYASARSPLLARISGPADPARRNERAQLHFMLGRCIEALAADDSQLEAALSEYSEAKRQAQDARLRARVFLKAALVEARLGRDDNALIQLAAARNNAETHVDLTSQIHLQALSFGQGLAAVAGESRASALLRAVRYFDWVAQNNLRDGYAVCEAQFEAANARLELATLNPDEGEALRSEAISGLRWIKSEVYRGYGRVYGPALARLFELRRAQFEVRPELPADDPFAPANEMLELAQLMAEGATAFQSRFEPLLPCLVRASWLARMNADSDRATRWLTLCRQYGSSESALWARAQLLLLAEERQQGSAEERAGSWSTLTQDLARLERSPSTDALVAMAEFFSREPNEQTLRRVLADWLKKNDPWWCADAAPDPFIDYLVALRQLPTRRSDAAALFEKAAAPVPAGWLRLLRKRVDAWLPQERPNG